MDAALSLSHGMEEDPRIEEAQGLRRIITNCALRANVESARCGELEDEKRALQRQILDLQSAVLEQLKATGAQKDKADALAKKCAALEVRVASEPRVSRLGSGHKQPQPQQSVDKSTQTDSREPVEARAPSVVLATPAARGAASQPSTSKPRGSKRALQPPKEVFGAARSPLPMPVLLEIIKQHPELKIRIHEIVLRRDLSEQAKMAQIRIIAQEAQEGKAPSGAGPSSANHNQIHRSPTGEPQSEETATEMDII